MAIYPSSILSITNPTASDRLNSPDHALQHSTINDNVKAIQSFVGIQSSTFGLTYAVYSPSSDGGGHIQGVNKGGTNITSYAKGDILVASSSSVLTKLAVGTDGQVLVANSSVAAGIAWGAGVTPTTRVYATSSVVANGTASFMGIWTKPASLAYAVIEVQGAGGAGGTTTSVSQGAQGGGGGGYARIKLNASALPAAASILVGIGGSGVFGSTTNGGTTRFGSVLVAAGGSVAGAPGQGTLGDLNTGGSWGVAQVAAANGGPGGGSYFGGGGKGAIVSGTGAITGGTGFPYGGGGGGAYSGSNGDDASGGSGADGVVIITEY